MSSTWWVFLVLREIGVLIVSIMTRPVDRAAPHTAELGSMKMREEIDALRAPWALIPSKY